MATLNDILTGVLTRLEESPAIFWDSTNELLPIIVEGMCEATLLTGEPQVRQSSSALDLAANTTFFNLPANSVALLRIEGPGGLAVHKTTIFDLDMENTGWQNDPAGAVPLHWFPFGLKKFGIHPQLTADVQVITTTVQFPIPFTLPFTGNETIPFQSEFNDAFEEYGAHVARFKEGGPEFDAAISLLESYLALMEQMSKFAIKKDSLRFSKVIGAPTGVNPIEKK